MTKSVQRSFTLGDKGEEIVANMLLKKGLDIKKSYIDASHPYDFIVANVKTMRIEYLADIKTKPSRECRNDTGMDFNDYIKYTKASDINNLPFMVFFVDYKTETIYGEELSVLDEKCNRHISNGIIYWDTDNMKHYGTITPEEAKELYKLNERNSAYDAHTNNTLRVIQNKNDLKELYDKYKQRGGESEKTN